MLEKKSLIFRVIAGAALIYLGVNLIRSSLAEQPEHYMIYALAGVIFGILGLFWGIVAVKNLVTHNYKEMMDDDADEIERALRKADAATDNEKAEEALTDRTLDEELRKDRED